MSTDRTSPDRSGGRSGEAARASETLPGLLLERARTRGDATAFTFLTDGETEGERLTFAELARGARAVAAGVRAAGAAGERVLLLYPPGLAFVQAFYGCLLGGGVAVPAPASDAAQLRRTLPRLRAIARDSRPALVLTCAATAEAVRTLLPELLGADEAARVRVLETDGATPEDGGPAADAERLPDPDELAFLQYTSGSTADPKGVMIRHGNLAYTCRDIDHSWRFDADSVTVSWCPIFHDMGLVFGVAMPVYRGFHSVLLAPVAFIQKPVRWLAAISRYRATHSCGPNFAYDLAARKVTPEERAGLDLSSWAVTLNSAEPVRWETIEAFTEAFAPAGFRREAFSPGFGLAESTVKVVSTGRDEATGALALDAAELERDRVVPVDDPGPARGRSILATGGRRRVQWSVRHGRPVLDTELAIVDPDSCAPAPPDRVGEIWVRSPAVAAGYWNRPDATAETFAGYLAGTGRGPFLRTGDLGFLDREGHLHVTGRIKDLLVLRGRNVYPQDVEHAVEESHPALRPGCSTAFSIPAGSEERLVLVAERDPRRGGDPEELLAAVRRRVHEEFELSVYAALIVEPRCVPKTSSGKVQRKRARALLEGLAFDPVAASLPAGEGAPTPDRAAAALREATGAARTRRVWLHLAAHFAPDLERSAPEGTGAADVDPDLSLVELGLDFALAVRWTERLRRELGARLPATTLFETGLTLRGLAERVAEVLDAPLAALADDTRTDDGPKATPEPPGRGATAGAADVERWLARELARRLGVAADEIDPTRHFAHYGLDSVSAVDLAVALETWLGRPLPATLVWDHPTLRAAAEHLAAARRAPEPARPARRRATAEPVAIVGLACRFPGAGDVDAFWSLLREGRDAVREVPADRWDVDALYHPTPGVPGRMATRWGGFLEDVDRFDAGFFGISHREAARMDPQQRLLLEVAWEALEHGGQSPDGLRGSRGGVFVGLGSGDYARIQLSCLEAVDAYAATGNAYSVAAGRLSYALDLRGPSVALDTACSASLVALHQARRSLHSGECDLALAGGVNLILSPEWTVAFSHARMMAADGRCKTFDADADGYVRGEGCGIVVLKRLSDAVRDRDRVLAVVRGSAVNQDGHSNGLTAPNGPSQRAVIRAALEDAELAPADVDYVEAHGTGTPLGDPIEARALAEVLAPGRPAERPCLVGSVKTNVGHLEAAAGIAGLIKAVLALQHGEIPAHLHLKRVNPHIDLDALPLVIPTALRPWPASDAPRRAGVSSFGFGGTNAHVVLEEAPPRGPAVGPGAAERSAGRADRPVHPVRLSARTEAELREVAARLAGRLRAAEEPLGDVAYTLNTGRARLDERVCFAARSAAGLVADLEAFARGESPASARRGTVRAATRRRVAFLFTGQGAQYAGMGRELHRTLPVFRRALERCCGLFDARSAGGRPLLADVLGEAQGAAEALDRTGRTQPALFAVEWALYETWRSFGVTPAAVLGHSVGEIAAACAAGVLRLEDACGLVATRARLMDALPPDGGMASVRGEPEAVRAVVERFGGRLAVAGWNGPTSTVVAGEAGALDEALRALEREGARCTRLAVSHAFHSPLIEPMLDDLEWFCRTLPAGAPALPLVSNVTGRPHEGAPDAAYWRRHARSPVDFRGGVRALAALECDVWLEVGPHPALLPLAAAELRSAGAPTDALVPSLRRGTPDWDVLAGALGALDTAGVEVDWEGVDRDHDRARVALPTYPFARERHWIQLPGEPPRTRTAAPAPTPLATRMNSPEDSAQGPAPAPGSTPAAGAFEQVLALFREQTAVLMQLARGAGDAELEAVLVDARARLSRPGAGTGADSGAAGAGADAQGAGAPLSAGSSARPTPAPVAGEISPETVAGRVHDWIARIAGTTPVGLRPHQHLHRDLGFDSLMTVELDRRIRSLFPGVGEGEEMFTEDTTVQGLVDLVVARLREHGSMDLMTEHQRTARDYDTYSELIAKDPSETYVGGAFKSETHTLHSLRVEGRRIAGRMDVVNKYSGTSSFHLTQMGAYSFLVQLVQGYLCYKHGVTKEKLGMPKLNRIQMRWHGMVRTSTDIPAEVEETACREEDGVYTVEFRFSIADGAVTGVIEGFLPIASPARPEAARAPAHYATHAELIGMDPRATYTGGTFHDEAQEIHHLRAEGRTLHARLDVENRFSGTPHFHLTQMGTYSYLVQLMLGYFCYKHGVVKDELGMPTLEEFEIEWREMVTDSKDVRAVIEERSCTLEGGRYRVEFAFEVGEDNGRGRLVGRIPVPSE